MLLSSAFQAVNLQINATGQRLMKGKGISNVEEILRTDEILQFVASLYRMSRNLHPGDFKNWTITQLQRLIHVDSAWWGRAIFPDCSDKPEIHGNSLFHLPDDYVEKWKKIASSDTIAASLYHDPSEPFMSGVASDVMSAPLCDFLWHHGIDHVLCAMKIDTDLLLDAKGNMGESLLVDFLSLYRGKDGREFARRDKECLRLVMPHIVLSLNHCLEFSVLANHNGQTGNVVEVAMFDDGFMLNTPAPGFIHLVQQDYPDWDGCVLPDEIQRRIAAKDVSWKGCHFTLKIEPIDSYWCLRAYPSSLFSDLTEREAQIAELFAQGKTYMEIAGHINRAPATVRNHLQSIYLKLGIRNKVELVEKYHSMQ